VATLSLKERFESFMSQLGSVENIDSLMKPCNLPNRLRADYLACNRLVIIEQKSFDLDVSDKALQALLHDLVRLHGPIGVEGVTLADIIEVISRLPHSNPFKPRLRKILTQKIDDILSKADKQTRDTRKTFLIAEAIGVVVVLNERAQLIEPDYFVDKAWDMLHKRLPNGKLRYPENQVAIMISEAHRIPALDGSELIPIETVFSEAGGNNAVADAFAETLRRRWAEFNGALSRGWPGAIRDVTTRDPARLFEAN
jgi:hypothetical protein